MTVFTLQFRLSGLAHQAFGAIATEWIAERALQIFGAEWSVLLLKHG